MIFVALALFVVAIYLVWQLIPDPDAAGPRDIREDDLLPLTKRDKPSHVLDVWAGMAEVEFVPPTRRARDDLVSMGEAIDRAIALAAALPRLCANCGIYSVEREGDEICAHCVAVGHDQIRNERLVAN